jgi:hypothetical protein
MQKGVCTDGMQCDCGAVMSRIVVHDGWVENSMVDLSKVRWNVLRACSTCTLHAKGVHRCSTCQSERG